MALDYRKQPSCQEMCLRFSLLTVSAGGCRVFMPNVTSDYCLSKLSLERKEARKITDTFGVDKYRNSRNFRNFDSNTYTEKSLNEL